MAIWASEMKLDCRKCSEEEKLEHGYSERALQPWELDGEELWRCPLTQITKASYEYLQAFTYLENGYGWPNAGGWQEQPAKFIEVINVIKAAFSRLEEERRKEEEKKAENNG